MFNIPVFCINLERSTKRYNKCKDDFDKFDITINRFDAIDGSKLFINKNLYNLFDNLILPTYNTTFNSRFARWMKPNINLHLSKGEYGCSLSHISLWQKIAKENYDIVIIVEDDVKPLSGISNLTQKISQIPQGWDIIYISFVNCGKKDKIHHDIFIPKAGWTTSGYIVNNKSCKKLLSFLPMEGPIDVHLLKLFNTKKINAYVIENICDSSNVWGGNDSNIEHTCIKAAKI